MYIFGGTFKNILTIKSAESGMGTCEYLVATLLLGYKFRRAMFKSEEKTTLAVFIRYNWAKNSN